MKNIIRKSITVITVFAIMLTLAMPVTAEAATKKAPKLNKSKVTLTITKKKTKPTVQLKVKNTAGKKVKWTSSNKKVVTVSAKGKVTAKKKGSAVVKAKVGNRTLKCKVTVKDTRKNTSNKPNRNTDENNSNTDNSNTTCQHKWVTKSVDEEVTVIGCQCACGEIFENSEDWHEHRIAAGLNHEHGHGSFSDVDVTKTVTKTYEYCEKCGVRK
ncbi:MAG: Ig-like domain-containing protein [Lachnospiraceae bacterium]|nr:Ig-like domain-containing protein [Lachnospiraceae bacterium]